MDSDVFIDLQLHEICSFPCNVPCLFSDTFFQNSILFPPLSLPCLSREAICTVFYSMVLPCCPVFSLTHSYLNVWKTCKQKLHLKTVGANDNLACLNTKNITLMVFYWLRKSCFFCYLWPKRCFSSDFFWGHWRLAYLTSAWVTLLNNVFMSSHIFYLVLSVSWIPNLRKMGISKKFLYISFLCYYILGVTSL